MGTSREKAERHKAHVIDVAGILFRERGFNGIGVSDLMKSAGLTHGGFYANFASKDELCLQAFVAAIEKSVVRLNAFGTPRTPDALANLVRFYLSESHRDDLGHGCPLAALGAEVARGNSDLKVAFKDGVDKHVELIRSLFADPDCPAAEKKASLAVVTMLGALVASRAVDDNGISKQILEIAAEAILSDVAV